jgi:hypothetical protein
MAGSASSSSAAVKDTLVRIGLATLAAAVALVIVELTIGVKIDDKREAGEVVSNWYVGLYGGIVLAFTGAALLGYIGAAGGSTTRGLIEAAKGAAIGLTVGLILPWIAEELTEAISTTWVSTMLPSALVGGLFGLGLGLAQRNVRQALITGAAAFLGAACARGLVYALDLTESRTPKWVTTYLAIALFVSTFVVTAQLISRVAWMTVVDGPLTGKQFIVSNAVTTIGKNYQCDLVFAKDPMIADTHLRIDRDKNGQHTLYVAPGASAAVNGQLAGSALLNSGDIVTIGATSLRFELRTAD